MLGSIFWIPACAGMTEVFASITVIPAKAGIQGQATPLIPLIHHPHGRIAIIPGSYGHCCAALPCGQSPEFCFLWMHANVATGVFRPCQWVSFGHLRQVVCRAGAGLSGAALAATWPRP